MRPLQEPILEQAPNQAPAGKPDDMIIEGDFLRHWKTRYFQALLGGDAQAPVYLLAIWLHLYDRRTDALRARPDVVATVAGYQGNQTPEAFVEALLEAELFTRDGDTIIAHGFKERHARSFANWENGSLGGRPRALRPRPEPEPEPGPGPDKGGSPIPPGNASAKPSKNLKTAPRKPKADAERCPHKEMQDFWNQTAGRNNLRLCKVWPEEEARARWTDPWFREGWKEIIEQAARNAWCREHRIGVDHILRKSNARRYYEEAEGRKPGQPGQRKGAYTAGIMRGEAIELREFGSEAEAVKTLKALGFKQSNTDPTRWTPPEAKK